MWLHIRSKEKSLTFWFLVSLNPTIVFHLLALCSPSAAITLALASLAASASAAMALCNCSGTLTSFTSTRSTLTPQGSVASSKADFHKIKSLYPRCQAKSVYCKVIKYLCIEYLDIGVGQKCKWS